MATILRPVNGVTAEQDVHFNQYADAFKNIFDIDDTTQEGPNRFIVPKLVTGNPGSPETGRMWFTEDEGASNVGGRLKIQHANNGGQIVPYLPLRQIKRGPLALTADFLTTSTTFVDVTNLTVSITVTGGRVRITIVPIDGNPYLSVGSTGVLAAFNKYGALRAVVGATNLASHLFGDTAVPVDTSTIAFPLSAFVWDVAPGGGVLTPGTYTVKIQACVLSTSSRLAIGFGGGSGVQIQVEEYGD